ncbi:(2Fe-2S)-binding protein [Neomoorella glycerini]|uniref:(2Fe-2S)-binding protein n=1 Tax=Neomoorella glycerini TaxID=55779 RepID=UPI0012E190E7|nr:(2Fe-2S)-binding protein [Moorella glycerini]
MLDDDIIVCRCEEVTAGEVRAAMRAGCRSLAAIRRFTRAGMGLCQGRTCTLLLRQILLDEGEADAEITPPRPRPPVRVLSMENLKPVAPAFSPVAERQQER